MPARSRPEQHGLGLDALDAEAHEVRQPLDGVAVDADAVEPGASAPQHRASRTRSVSRRCRGLRGQPAPSAPSAAHAAPKPTMAGDVLEPGPAGPLLVAADQQRRQAQAPADQQRADARRPAELVGADRQQVGAERPEVDRARARPPGRRRRAPARPARGSRPPPRRPAGPCPPRGCPTARAPARCRGRTAASTSSASTRPGAVDADDGVHLAVPRGRLPHGRVLDGRHHLVRAPGRPRPSTAAAIASVAPLVNTTSRLRAPSSVGDLLAGLLDGDPGGQCPRRGCGPGSPTDARARRPARPRASGRSGEVEAWSR